MSIEQGATAGGDPNRYSLAAPENVFHPVVVEQRRTDGLLVQAAEIWAPGPGSVDWAHWEAATPAPSQQVLPGPVRIGVTERGVPLLTPFLGEAHFAVGDPDLLHPVPKPALPRLPVMDVKTAKREADERYGRQEAARRRRLHDEHDIAIGVTQSLITRSIASLAPGTVTVDVYDPIGRGQAFSDFSLLGQVGRLRLGITGDLPVMLENLEREITLMNGRLLGGHRTLRSQVAETGRGVRPWRIVALLGGGDVLSAQDQGRLDAIIQQGARCGISLITHGFHLVDSPRVNRLYINGREAQSSGSGPVEFTLDAPPPGGVMVRAAAKARPTGQEHLLPPEPTVVPPDLAIDVGEGRRLLPGANYRAVLTGRTLREREVAAIMKEFAADHPFLDPGFLSLLSESLGPYASFANAAAADAGVARKLARSRATGDQLIIDSLQAQALLDLLVSTPGHLRERLTRINSGAAAGGQAERHISALTDVVRTTIYHGLDQLPAEAGEYIANYLPVIIPPYIFQLVADHGDGAQGRMPKASALAAWDATLFHLEGTYGVQLREPAGQTLNRALAECLVECELLRLYNFEHAQPELRLLLAQRAYKRLLAVSDHEVPPFAQSFRAPCLQFLEENGGPVLSAAGRAARAALAVGGVVGSTLGAAFKNPANETIATPPVNGTNHNLPGTNGSLQRQPDPPTAVFERPIYVPPRRPNNTSAAGPR